MPRVCQTQVYTTIARTRSSNSLRRRAPLGATLHRHSRSWYDISLELQIHPNGHRPIHKICDCRPTEVQTRFRSGRKPFHARIRGPWQTTKNTFGRRQRICKRRVTPPLQELEHTAHYYRGISTLEQSSGTVPPLSKRGHDRAICRNLGGPPKIIFLCWRFTIKNHF